MENAAYVALSRQIILRRELEVAANNIANADTTGFKLEQLLTRTESAAPARNAMLPGPARFTLDDGVGRDFRQGELKVTKAPLDFAIEGDAFFQVRGDQGDRFTRDGRFATDATGRLVTVTGDAVLGDGGEEIRLDPSLGPIAVAGDGIITQQGQRVGKVGVVRFDDLSVLSKDGDGLYRNTANVQPNPAPDARVRQGMLEGSNVQPLVEITNLIEISRAYERMAKIIDQAEELSRRSVERLGRVN